MYVCSWQKPAGALHAMRETCAKRRKSAKSSMRAALSDDKSFATALLRALRERENMTESLSERGRLQADRQMWAERQREREREREREKYSCNYLQFLSCFRFFPQLCFVHPSPQLLPPPLHPSPAPLPAACSLSSACVDNLALRHVFSVSSLCFVCCKLHDHIGEQQKGRGGGRKFVAGKHVFISHCCCICRSRPFTFDF